MDIDEKIFIRQSSVFENTSIITRSLCSSFNFFRFRLNRLGAFTDQRGYGYDICYWIFNKKLYSQVKFINTPTMFIVRLAAIFYCLSCLWDVCCVANARGGRVWCYIFQTRNVWDRKIPSWSPGSDILLLSLFFFPRTFNRCLPLSSNRNHVSGEKSVDYSFCLLLWMQMCKSQFGEWI